MSVKKMAVNSKSMTTIKMSNIDPTFKYELSNVQGSERLKLCFQCGTCTADCPIARFSDIYHPRKLMRMTQLGMKDRILESEALWLCAACFTCVDHCPQGVDIASVFRALRNIAVREGIVPAVFRELFDNIQKTGYAYKIPELRHKKRAEFNLPVLPEANTDDIAKLFKVISVAKVMKKEK
jgi:heterodisulfide reductase subunit C